MQCRKVAVLAVVTDCEERNKQALLEIEKMYENNTMPPELLLLTLSRVVYQIQLERNGVTIDGKPIAYPKGIHHLESIAKSDSSVVYFTAAKSPHCNGGLYRFDIESSEVTNVLENMTVNCREIRKVARFKGTLVFTDVGGRQVKWYNPSTKNVETLA